ncbi:tetratricopeptide repeat protein [Thiovibrio sp. JS02]
MSQSEQAAANGLKKETVILIALGCLVIGFLGGIVFSVYKSPGGAGGGAQPVSQQQPPQQNAGARLTAEQAQRMLQLEMEVQKNPGNVEAWTSLGHLYFDSDAFEKAINAYNKSLELNPNNADVLTDLGVMYRRAGNPQQAIATFDRAITFNSRHETARFNKGIVLLYDLKDKDGAVKAWQELVDINPMATAPNGQLVKDILPELKSR